VTPIYGLHFIKIVKLYYNLASSYKMIGLLFCEQWSRSYFLVVNATVLRTEVETRAVVEPVVEVWFVETGAVVEPEVEVWFVETGAVVEPEVEVWFVETGTEVGPEVADGAAVASANAGTGPAWYCVV
jgi:hypothetical protein